MSWSTTAKQTGNETPREPAKSEILTLVERWKMSFCVQVGHLQQGARVSCDQLPHLRGGHVRRQRR